MQVTSFGLWLTSVNQQNTTSASPYLTSSTYGTNLSTTQKCHGGNKWTDIEGRKPEKAYGSSSKAACQPTAVEYTKQE